MNEITMLANACPLSVLIEEKGNVVLANQPAQELFGATESEDLTGVPVTELLTAYPSDPASISDRSGVWSAKVQALDARQVPVSVTSREVSMDGKPMKAHFLDSRVSEGSTDSTQQQFAARIDETLNHIRKAGHDLNQPLTIISGKLQLVMLDMNESDPIYPTLKTINDAVFRLSDLVRNISVLIKSLQGFG